MMSTIQPLVALREEDQFQEVLELARQKVETATNPDAWQWGADV